MIIRAKAETVNWTDQTPGRSGLPLTSAQMPNWLEGIFFPGKPISNTGAVVTLTGKLDQNVLDEAVRRVVHETDTLRLRLRLDGQQICQEILDLPNYSMERLDYSAL